MENKELLWNEYVERQKELIIFGLKNGYIDFYNDELIEKLRNIYYGGVPASLILLTNGLTNGYCYDRAVLLSRALLDSEDDINLIYATVDGLYLNPKLYREDANYGDHCFVERITSNNESIIYDTSMGLLFTKDIYWMIENPKVRQIRNKEEIRKFVEDISYDGMNEWDGFTVNMILPMIERRLELNTEIYACDDFPILQREIEYVKDKLKNDDIYKREEEYYEKRYLK